MTMCERVHMSALAGATEWLNSEPLGRPEQDRDQLKQPGLPAIGMPNVTSSRHRVLAALALLAIGLGLGGCQKAITVGAVDRCGANVEVKAGSVSNSSSGWRLEASTCL
ncbi:hypothetical protein M2302_005761 [Micromonospora sp. A200]|nr:hypothetical protein [Micromonospora sp. A200]